jgi:hypothetical protein
MKSAGIYGRLKCLIMSNLEYLKYRKKINIVQNFFF